MRAEIEEQYITKYDSPMTAYIDLKDCYDETSGDVEAPTGWFGRAGKWLVMIDEQGFVASVKYPTQADCVKAFEGLDFDYSTWSTLEDES